MTAVRRWLSSDAWAGWPVWLWIALAGVVVRLGYLGITAAFSPVPDWATMPPDAKEYVHAAASILHGRYETFDDPRFHYYRSPGYPALVALVALVTRTQPGGWPLLVVQAFMSGLWCALIYLLARRLRLAAGVATLAGLAAVMDPTAVALTPVVLSDLPTATVLLASTWFLVVGVQDGGRVRFAASGLLLGYAVLMRPASYGFIVVWLILALLWPRERHLRPSALALLVAVALVLPLAWATHVHSRTGVWALDTISSQRFYTCTATGLAARGDPHTHARLFLAARRREQRFLSTMRSEQGRVRWEQAQADSAIHANLDGIPLHVARTTAYVLLSPSKEYYLQFPRPPGAPTTASLPYKLFSVALAALSAWGLIVLAVARDWRSVGVLAVVTGSALAASLFVGAIGGERIILPGAFGLLTSGAAGAWWFILRISNPGGEEK